jgi:hemoglobin/transferrin/lactoferrin receptor protein
MFLKETLVTGTRYPRAYYESPQAMSFLLRNQIRDRMPTVSGDVLSTLPGVDMSKDSPWEQRPVLRGLSGQRVLVLVDGSPMNSARGNGPHPSLVDPAQVERIEVVRGPSSVAYGSDAIGGAINIITREAAFPDAVQSFRGSATLAGSTADNQRGGYLELMPRIGRFSAFVSSGARKAENFDTPDSEVRNSGFSDYNALANLRYDLTSRTALKAGYQLYRGDGIGIPGLSFEMPGARQDFQFSYYDRDWAHLTLERSHEGSWIEGTRSRVYYQRERRDFYSDQALDASMFPSFGVPPRAGASTAQTLQDRYLDLDTWGLQAQLTSARLGNAKFTAGLDAARDITDGDNVRYRTYYDAAGNPVPGPGGTPPTAVRVTASLPDGKFDNYGAFTQGEWFVASDWTVSGGVRYTHYRYRTEAGPMQPAAGPIPAASFTAQSVDDDAFSGSAGVTWNARPDLHVTANVASGYRQPNAQDLFFSGPASVGYVLGNPDLMPERSMSYDTGLRWGPGTLGLAGNLYYSTYNDLIDAVSVPPPPEAGGQPSYQYVNISEARIWGGEAEAEWRFLPRWTARGAVAGQIGDITSAEAIEELYGVTAETAPLPGVPPFKGSLALRYTDGSGRFWIEPAARYSWRTNRLPLPTPGVPQTDAFKKEWMVADLFAGASLPWNQRVVVGVRNIADASYRQPLASLDEPGISFVGSLSLDF